MSLIAILEELLDDVVAKNISHELKGARGDFIEHGLLVGARGSLEFLLNEAGTVLISAKLDNVTENVLEIRSGTNAHIPLARISYSLHCGTLPASGCEGFGDYPHVVSHLSRHVEHQDVRQMSEPQTVADIRFDIQDTAMAEIVDDKIVHE